MTKPRAKKNLSVHKACLIQIGEKDQKRNGRKKRRPNGTRKKQAKTFKQINQI